MRRPRSTALALVVALLAGCGRVPLAYQFLPARPKPDGPLVAWPVGTTTVGTVT